MSQEQFQSLPQWLDVRVIEYTLENRGNRTRHVLVWTTLLDEQAWPDDRLAELLINPYRPGRREPRVIRRRLKEYNLMKSPRAELKKMDSRGENRLTNAIPGCHLCSRHLCSRAAVRIGE